MTSPIHSSQIERNVVAACMVDAGAAVVATAYVRAEDFFIPLHRSVFASVQRLIKARQPVSTLDVLEDMRRNGVHVDEHEVLSLTDTLASVHGVEAHARTVAMHAARRRVQAACAEHHALGFDAAIDDDAYISAAAASISTLASSATRADSLVHIDTATTAFFIRLQERAASGGISGLTTGIAALDEATTGFHPGELIVVAGRPGMGKTAFAANALRASAAAGKHALMFSLEMGHEEVSERLIAAESRTNIRALRAGQLSQSQWSEVATVAGTIAQWPIWIDATPAIRIAAIRAQARRVAARGDLGVIVVDYLQLIGGDVKTPREQQISETSRVLKELAKEHRCPVVALSQLNRQCESRPDKRPHLSDLRESGAIEQDADAVLLLFRPRYYTPESEAPDEIIIAKQRNGPTCTINARFVGHLATYVDE